MKNLIKRTEVVLFVAFLSGSMILTLSINFKGMIGSLYENKEALFRYKTVFPTVAGVFSDNLFLLEKYSYIYGSIQRLQGKNAVWDNDVGSANVIGDDGKLYTLNLFSNRQKNGNKHTEEDKSTVLMCADALSDFAKEVARRDGKLFFVQAPARYDSSLVKLPLPQASADTQEVDELYKKLKDKKNVHVLNMQRRFKDRGIEFGIVFYKTDHHWTTKTAFLAYQEICKEINGKTDIHIEDELFNLKSWETKTKKGMFLGSLGSKAGGGFVGKDDFDLIFPKFETKYKKTVAYVPQLSIQKGGSCISEGSFTEAVLDCEEKNIYYGVYVHPDVSEVILENFTAEQKGKLLIIKDSFALPVSAFLSTCFKETRLLDLRYYKDGVLNYLDNYKPDVVLVLYNPSSYKEMFFSFE